MRNNRYKKLIFKNGAPFTDCISEINNKEIDHAKDNDAVMPRYNLIEYSDNYSKTSGSLLKCYRIAPFTNNGAIIDVPFKYKHCAPFKYKQKITGQPENNGTKDVQIMALLKYASNV